MCRSLFRLWIFERAFNESGSLWCLANPFLLVLVTVNPYNRATHVIVKKYLINFLFTYILI